MRCVEWVLVVACTSVDGLREVYVVEEFIVEVYAYVVFGPIHAPRVEAFVPIGVALEEVLVGYAFRVPYRAVLVVAPTGVGQYVWTAVHMIVFHDIDFATRGPTPFAAEQPDGWPRTDDCWYACAHFEGAVEKLKLTTGVDARCRISGVGSALLPVVASGVVGTVSWVGYAVEPSLYGEYSIGDASVGRLIPLIFVVAHESLLVVPILGIGCSVGVELVVPQQCALCRECQGGGYQH